MWERVREVLSEAFARLGAEVAADLPGLVAMLVVMACGVALAFAARGLLRRALARVDLDRRAREWGVTTGRSLEPRRAPSWVVARAAFWAVLLAAVALALDVLGASTSTAAGQALLAALPRLVVGAAVLLAGIAAARFLERSVLIGLVNLQVQGARHAALAVKWLVLVLAATMALEHVGIAGGLARLAFGIVLGGVVLAAALAFGLGARDAVARALERRLPGDGAAPPASEPGGGRIHHL